MQTIYDKSLMIQSQIVKNVSDYVVNRLSKKYGFDERDAHAYLETSSDVASPESLEKSKCGRPEKHRKETRGETEDEAFCALIERSAPDQTVSYKKLCSRPAGNKSPVLTMSSPVAESVVDQVELDESIKRSQLARMAELMSSVTPTKAKPQAKPKKVDVSKEVSEPVPKPASEPVVSKAVAVVSEAVVSEAVVVEKKVVKKPAKKAVSPPEVTSVVAPVVPVVPVVTAPALSVDEIMQQQLLRMAQLSLEPKVAKVAKVSKVVKALKSKSEPVVVPVVVPVVAPRVVVVSPVQVVAPRVVVVAEELVEEEIVLESQELPMTIELDETEDDALQNTSDVLFTHNQTRYLKSHDGVVYTVYDREQVGTIDASGVVHITLREEEEEMCTDDDDDEEDTVLANGSDSESEEE
jgi:hypothetical protein